MTSLETVMKYHITIAYYKTVTVLVTVATFPFIILAGIASVVAPAWFKRMQVKYGVE